MALPEGTLLHKERYQIRKLLAQGGFGFVYLAFDNLAQRKVVLKELNPALLSDVEMLRRFVREGRTMQRLRHPNLVRTGSMFKDEGNSYLVLEYLSGGALSDRTDRGHRLSLTRVAEILAALSDVLSYLHGMGIVHCDLNPSNILLDGDENPKLIDLGVAYIPDSLVHRHWHTQRDVGMGTVFYMAPEQLDGVRDDPRIDVYALGAIAYQLLSGSHYLNFDLSNTPGAYAYNVDLIRTKIPTPLSNVPLEVAHVIMRALAKNPDARYRDATVFRQEFVQALSHHVTLEEKRSLAGLFRQRGRRVRGSEMPDWPRWVWRALVAVNVIVMAVIALLLIGAA
jgi:serine/threonine protein kinase